MSAFVIAHSTVLNPTKFQSYAKLVPATLKPFGGEVALRGKVVDILAGQHTHQSVGVIRFPDTKAAKGWYASAAYQALISERDQAATITVLLYEEPQP